MTIEYTWKILGLECDTSEQPCKRISRAHWQLTGVENGFTGVSFGIAILDYIIPTNVSIDDITENDIILIIKEKFNTYEFTGAYESIERSIQGKNFAVNTDIPLPWLSNI